MTFLAESPDFVLEWCKRLGANLDTVMFLKGGINNQVFRCRAGQTWFVLKSQQKPLRDGPDRFKAEVEFLNYAKLSAPGFTPHLLYHDEESRSMVLEYIKGQPPFDDINRTAEQIKRANAFIKHINRDLNLANDHVSQAATEGFLMLTEHLENIEKRLLNMSETHVPSAIKSPVKNFIRELKNQLSQIVETTAYFISRGLVNDALGHLGRCVSPGDFGFHNSIQTKEGLRFIDFEFAGWDDPAKTIVDFDLHPGNRIREKNLILLHAVGLNKNDEISLRCKYLKPILALKWACIIAGILNKERMEEILRCKKTLDSEKFIKIKISQARNYLLESQISLLSNNEQ